jgi:hypothetical protein
MRKILEIVASATMAAFFCAPAVAAEKEPPSDPDLGTDIVRAIAFQDQLWVLGESSGNGSRGGALVSFTLSDGSRTLRLRGAMALEKTGGRLFALTSDGPLEWKDGKFAALPALTVKSGDVPTALLAVGDRLGLETSANLFVLDEAGWRVLTTFKRVAPPKNAFSADVLAPYASAEGMPVSAATLYTGFNHGEWGGGLDYRDLKTGVVGSVRDTTAAASQGKPQSVDDNINAIIADPAHDDCAIVAAGLIHFMASGRLLRACGDTATLFFSSTPPKSGPDSRTIDDLSEAFFGLVRARDGFWAVSNAAVYRFGSSGQPQRYVLSRFEPWHGLWINRETPGALVLVTEINRRFSVNNGTPLIVPLD